MIRKVWTWSGEGCRVVERELTAFRRRYPLEVTKQGIVTWASEPFTPSYYSQSSW